MLQPPYTRYDQLHVYNFDRTELGEINDPDLIGTWIEDDTAILFFHKAKKELVKKICDEQGAEIIYQAQLDYKDWEAGIDIASFTVPPLIIRPIWEPASDKTDDQLMEIPLDPSVIFGSGFHPTTRLCLEILCDLYGGHPDRFNSVMDLGCGTGLLAIAADKLGGSDIVAFDNNPFACQVARRNLELNRCSDNIEVIENDLRTGLPDTGVDLVIANLYKGLLVDLFNRNTFWKASYYLISGFIPSMEEELLAALPMAELKLIERRQKDNWRAWLLARKDVSPTMKE
ncbi:MAG: 50S ribosomal protein L11 methyltransferase [Thermodesulfobacteriota bacterium]